MNKVATLRLVTLAVCIIQITGAVASGGANGQIYDLTARVSPITTTPSSLRKNSSHSHHDTTTVRNLTNPIPNTRLKSFKSNPLTFGGRRVVESIWRKQSPAKYKISAHHNWTSGGHEWTPGGYERKDNYTPVADTPKSSGSSSDGSPSLVAYTSGINVDGRKVTKRGALAGRRRKRETGPRQCTADIQCAPTECCLEDQLGTNPLALVCMPRQNNGYCGRRKACRYAQNCKSPGERCVLTRVIFHPRYWSVPIGYCATQ